MPQEATLADPVSTRPLALTVGAAAATLVVIVGVLTGPALIDCFGTSDNPGLCLRGKLIATDPAASNTEMVASTEAEATPVVEETATVAEPEALEPEAETASASDVETPVETETVLAATFGLLRAEPDGSVLIAGSGTPGSEVEVYANGDLIGSTTVEPTGDWVLLPENPIEPGGAEITLSEVGKTGESNESFVVLIDPEFEDQPLVVASTPGESTEILQGLVRDQAPDMDVAAIDPDQASEPASIETAPSPEDAGDIAADEIDAPSEVQPATPDTPAAEPESVEPEIAEAEEATEPAAAAEPTEPQIAFTGDDADPVAPDLEVAAVDPQSPTVPVFDLEGPSPSIDAIEIDGDLNFFAGGGPNGATMRLYVDDVFIADATVDGERWLVEAEGVLTGSDHRIRIDMLIPNTSQVASRAEVNFRVDLPEPAPETDIQVAGAPETETPTAAAPASLPEQDIVTPTDEPVTEPAPQPAAPEAVIEDAAPAIAETSEPPATEPPAPTDLAEPQEPVETPQPDPAPMDLAALPDPAPVETPSTGVVEPSVVAPEIADTPEASSAEPPAATDPADVAELPDPVEMPDPAPALADTAALPEAEPVAVPEADIAEPETALTEPPAPAVAADLAEPRQPVIEPADEPVAITPPSPAAEPDIEIAQTPEVAPAPQPAPEPEPAQADAAPEEPATAVTPEPTGPVEPVEPEPAPVAPSVTELEIPTLVATSVGDPEAQRFASGRAIIRRGDNLWTIARRVYGEGIKYTTIYEANAAQIRNPNRIYPGQVFALPTDAE